MPTRIKRPFSPPQTCLWLKPKPRLRIAGNLLTYTLLAVNAGPANAQNVILTDRLPAGRLST